MEKSNLTKELLAERFHELMLHRDFEKITIKHITDQAGVIRPTFYYHFQDKYDVLEYIVKRDVTDPVKQAVEQGGLDSQGIEMVFKAINEDKTFYQKAFKVTGQNGFFEILFNNFKEICMKAFDDKTVQPAGNNTLNSEMAAVYYSVGLVNVIRLWIGSGKNAMSVEEICRNYEYLITHSVYDFLKKN